MTLDYRDRFYIPPAADGRECAYLCGHSLGLQPKSVRGYVERELKDWELLGVEGHFRARHPWVEYGKLLTEQTARLVGALPLEVVTMNALTVNLHLMMVSFYRPTARRHRIVMEEHAFPSDRYAVKSQVRFQGFDPAESVVTVAGEDELEEFLGREGESVALVLIGGINYSSGRSFDMARVARVGHAVGSVVGFDLAHAAGNLVLKLHDWNADFAVWCTYKYLNGGPGSIAGCFVHERHARDDGLPRFAGWWGHELQTRFRMGPDFVATPGAEGWQVSNPPVVALAALRASMDLFDEAGMERLRARSVELTGALESLLDGHADRGFSIVTPRDPERRGAQLSIRVPGSVRAVWERLAAAGVVCDWREPDILRVAPAPMYNTVEDIGRFVDRFVAGLG
ncbi:MAG: kynureninase [Bryobacteraceae bacterium]